MSPKRDHELCCDVMQGVSYLGFPQHSLITIEHSILKFYHDVMTFFRYVQDSNILYTLDFTMNTLRCLAEIMDSVFRHTPAPTS